MNSFFIWTWRSFFFPRILEDSLTGYSNLGWRLFSLRVWPASFPGLPHFGVSPVKSAITGWTRSCTWWAPLICSIQLSVFVLYLSGLSLIRHWEVLFWSFLLRILNVFCSWASISFPRFGTFPFSLLWLYTLSFPINADYSCLFLSHVP